MNRNEDIVLDWSALFSTLGLIFIAELGDKTQLAVITQTCKHRRPWSVFLGASLALTLVTLIGALGGQLLSQFIPTSVLRLVASAAFIVMGLLIFREALKSSPDNENACALNLDAGCTPASGWNWQAFASTFGLLFVAELGDKTQLAVLSMASKSFAPWSVFAGGTLALILVTGIGVVGGQSICKLVPERTLLTVSAAAFVLMGVLMAVGIL